MDLILRTEARLPVDSWRAGGVRIWPLVRITLYTAGGTVAVPGASLGNPFANARMLVRGVAAWAWNSLRDASHNEPEGRPCDVLFLTSSIGTQPLVQGRRVNPLLAPYVELFSEQAWTAGAWEMAPYGHYNTPRHTPSHFMQPAIYLARIATLRKAAAVAPSDLAGFDDFLAEVRESGLPFRFLDRAALARDIAYLLRMAAAFERGLARSKPRLGAVANYGPQEQAFCLACSRLGIPTVDIQHGIQGSVHPAYGPWTRVPAGGYECRPRYFWCWDDASAATINAWATAPGVGGQAIVGGNAFADGWRTSAAGAVGRELDAEIAQRKRKSGASRHILVSLDSLWDVIPAPLAEAMDIAPRDWCFWLRLHPVNQRAQRRALRKVLRRRNWNLIDWKFTTETPLPALWRHVDAHLTVNWSTMVADAAAEGVASVACTERALEFFPDEARRGMLRIATTPSAIVEQLNRQIHARRSPIRRAAGADKAIAFLTTRASQC